MTIAKFIKDEEFYDVIKLKKKGGKKHYLLWWESSDTYFMNYLFTNSDIPNPKQSRWIIRRDSKKFLNQLKREGYKIDK